MCVCVCKLHCTYVCTCLHPASFVNIYLLTHGNSANCWVPLALWWVCGFIKRSVATWQTNLFKCKCNVLYTVIMCDSIIAAAYLLVCVLLYYCFIIAVIMASKLKGPSNAPKCMQYIPTCLTNT